MSHHGQIGRAPDHGEVWEKITGGGSGETVGDALNTSSRIGESAYRSEDPEGSSDSSGRLRRPTFSGIEPASEDGDDDGTATALVAAGAVGLLLAVGAVLFAR